MLALHGEQGCVLNSVRRDGVILNTEVLSFYLADHPGGFPLLKLSTSPDLWVWCDFRWPGDLRQQPATAREEELHQQSRQGAAPGGRLPGLGRSHVTPSDTPQVCPRRGVRKPPPLNGQCSMLIWSMARRSGPSRGAEIFSQHWTKHSEAQVHSRGLKKTM